MITLINRLTENLHDKRYEAGCENIQQGIASEGKSFVHKIREKGILRFSAFQFDSKVVALLLDRISESLPPGPDQRTVDYLRSLRALIPIAEAARSILKKTLRSINPRSFKNYLAVVDDLFLNEHEPQRGTPRTNWRHFIKEDLASAFSYYYSLLNEKAPLTEADLNCVVGERTSTEYYLNVLSDLAKIIAFKEVEILVEVYGYRALVQNKIISIIPPDDKLEASIRWGYIFAEQQQHADVDRLGLDLSQDSLLEAAADLLKIAGDKLFKVEDFPYQRIVRFLPQAEAFLEFFNSNTPFREEFGKLVLTSKTLLVEHSELRTKPIYKSITLFDLLKFQRLWLFWSAAFKGYCVAHGYISSPLYYRSLVPLFHEDGAYKGLSLFFGGQQKTDELFELLTWNKSKSKIFDVQYFPLIKIERVFAIPMGITSTSSLLRNTLQSARFRFDASGDTDYIGTLLMQTFIDANIPVKRMVDYRFNGVSGECDVLAAFGDVVFVFECKNSLHPCNTFELRQSYDYLLKAFEQLTRFKTLFADKEFVRLIESKTGFKLGSHCRIITCVVTGNRMFNGYRNQGHSVRNIFELCNFITSGTITLHLNDYKALGYEKRGTLRKCFWASDSFAPLDLENYLEHDTVHTWIFNAMKEYVEVTRFGSLSLGVKSFYLDTVTHLETFSQLPGVEFVEDQEKSEK